MSDPTSSAVKEPCTSSGQMAQQKDEQHVTEPFTSSGAMPQQIGEPRREYYRKYWSTISGQWNLISIKLERNWKDRSQDYVEERWVKRQMTERPAPEQAKSAVEKDDPEQAAEKKAFDES